MKRVIALLIAGTFCWSGCGPQNKVKLEDALASRVNPATDYNACARLIRDTYLKDDKSKDYVVWALEYSTLCMMNGDCDAARPVLMACYNDIKHRTGGETAATLTREDLKRFKGEPFERAMMCCYLGLLCYMQEDFENARVFFGGANLADQTTAENMAAYRDDFGLAHYFLGRCYLKANQDDNAAIAFRKAAGIPPGEPPAKPLDKKALAQAEKYQKKYQKEQAERRAKRARLEQLCYKNATTGKQPIAGVADMSACTPMDAAPVMLPSASAQSPVLAKAAALSEFLKPDFQRDANLIVLVEMGPAPVKVLVGENKEQDAILAAKFDERFANVYLDGHLAGEAFPVVDLFFQASTRGTSEKDAAQAGKSAIKGVLNQFSYTSAIAGLWDIRADDRFWRLMPSRECVLAAKVKPGVYTLRIECYDADRFLLPRSRVTRYYVPVQADCDNVYVIPVQSEADNVYAPPKK